MTRKMLIDAAHPEETRVVVLDGTRVEEFDFESQARRQLRGNIYLAKVTRVEPSLQAAFVEYGGNRHGFLAFNEIHPDYYQIPHADREALMLEAAEDDDDEPHHPTAAAVDEDGETVSAAEDDDEVDEEIERRRRRMIRRYKIQEVIRRRQIMLVQVVKEERGNKGAALTTYLSLAGRYCVLMPNTDRGGGISRKIASATDRKRLRTIVQSLDVPKGMGLIVRTAGAKRTKAEIKRDYDYLERSWESIRDTTLHSVAPALIYEEEDLVKRAIRDLYDKDIESVWVEGEAGFKEAREFMRMLMPAQAKKVQAYREPTPLFVRHRIEDHLSQIYEPVAPLKSGGYLVINQTEALVAIDVNSGRATRERNIEATALKTNMEAAEEACRQLRLRDLAGLIVIDFIDMEESKNNRAVEKRLKDCLKDDRARIQMGKISQFGLMEMSRQRRRTGILEGTTHVCPHCQGAGRIRSTESSALAALRAVEMEGLRGGGEVTLRVAKDVGLYMLNAKRDYLVRLRQTHGLWVNVVLDDSLSAAEHQIDRVSSEAPPIRHEAPAVQPYDPAEEEDELVVDEDEDEDEDMVLDDEDEDELREEESDEDEEGGNSRRDVVGDDGQRRGRRRRRRGRRGEEPRGAQDGEPRAQATQQQQPREARPPRDDQGGLDAGGGEGRRRRRGRRGGRRMREDARPGDVYGWSWPSRPVGDDPYQWRGPVPMVQPAEAVAERTAQPAETRATAPAPEPRFVTIETASDDTVETMAAVETPPTFAASEEVWVELPAESEKPARAPRRRRGKAAAEPVEPVEAVEVEAPRFEVVAEPVPLEVVELSVEPAAPEPAPEPEPEAVVAATPAAPVYDANEINSPPASPRRGWWRRGA